MSIVVKVIEMVESEIESRSMIEVETLVEKSRVKRHRNLEMKRNILVENRSRWNSDMAVKEVDSTLVEERQSLIDLENEGDNRGKMNLKIDCSWSV